ncbi:hypothetical protein [Synechococcus sp. CC9311]|uniref:hypothetical protein n=1 Tax=Synechococcus sp. (strain CC9311) TaxID=64471 RepID=UPI001ED93DD2|nr:hypothetical protein [Synechococcus sp. CC9311]
MGQDPSATTEALSANILLPEDAIQLAKNEFIVADTGNKYLKRLYDGKLSVVAGSGGQASKLNLSTISTPSENLTTFRVIKLNHSQWLSFSKEGIRLHSPKKIKFIANSYTLNDENYVLNFPQFAKKTERGIFVFDGEVGRKRFLKLQDNLLIPAKLLSREILNRNLMGFDICGERLVISLQNINGDVTFYRESKNGVEYLFSDRPYSNGIKCIDDNGFIYGARWELKMFKNGTTSVLSDRFVHISSIRDSLKANTFVITDSDSDEISLFDLETKRKDVVISRENAFLSSVITQFQLLADGKTLLAMTPTGSIIRYNISTKSFHRLIDPNRTAIWNHLLNGHKFESLRAFALDEINNFLYLASNHGIFKLNLQNGEFALFAGSESEYGNSDASRLEARFAVIRDLLLFDGSLYIADAWNDKVRQIDLKSDMVKTILGSGMNEIYNENVGIDVCMPALDMALNRPLSLAVFEDKLIVANSYSHYLVSLPLSNMDEVCLFAGRPIPSKNQYGGSFLDGFRMSASFNGIQHISVSGQKLIVTDMFNNAIRTIDANGNVKTLFAFKTHTPQAAIFHGGNLIFSALSGTLNSARINDKDL